MTGTVGSGVKPGGAGSFSDVMADSFWLTAPFYSLIKKRGRKGITFNGEPKDGHSWTCDDVGYVPDPDNAKSPAGCEVNPTYTPPIPYHNELQTWFKDSSLADEVKAAKGCRVAGLTMKEIQLQKRNEMAQDIDASLFREDAPVASADGISPRKMAGVKHYVPASNKIDLGNLALNPDTAVTQALQLLVDNGVKGTYVMVCGSDVFNDVTTFYNNKVVLNTTDKVGGMDITSIKNGFGTVEIMNSTRLEKNEFLIITLEYIGLVTYREYMNKLVSTPSCDAETRQDLTQQSLQVCPTSVVWMTNAGRAKVCSDC